MPAVRRAFIHEYGITEYNNWRNSKQPMRQYESELLERLGRTDTTPVIWNEYENNR